MQTFSEVYEGWKYCWLMLLQSLQTSAMIHWFSDKAATWNMWWVPSIPTPTANFSLCCISPLAFFFWYWKTSNILCVFSLCVWVVVCVTSQALKSQVEVIPLLSDKHSLQPTAKLSLFLPLSLCYAYSPCISLLFQCHAVHRSLVDQFKYALVWVSSFVLSGVCQTTHTCIMWTVCTQ